MISVAELVRRYGTNSTILAPEIPNYQAAKDIIMEMVKSGPYSKKLILVDKDLDGILSGEITLESCEDLGIKGVRAYIPEVKCHGLTSEIVEYIIENKIDFVIIPDSSSGCLEELRCLSDAGVRVLIIDHHSCSYSLEDYPVNVVIVNNKMFDVNCREVSAGMLCYLLFTKLYGEVGIEPRIDHHVWAYASVIADSCKLNDHFISPIIKSISSFSNNVPYIMSLFMSDYDSLNRNFISYKFANKINTLARTDNTEIIDKLFFKRKSLQAYEIEKLVMETNSIYNNVMVNSRNFATQLINYVEDLNNFGFINLGKFKALTDLPMQYLINSTGYFSSKLGSDYGKPVIVVAPDTQNSYRVSIRGNSSNVCLVDILDKLNLDGGGHNGAIGFTISKGELADFKMYIKMFTFEDQSTDISNYLSIRGDDLCFKDFERIMNICAMHNETAGAGVPEVYISKKLNFAFKRKDYERMVEFRMGKVKVKCFDTKIDTDKIQLIKPIFENGVVGIVQ